MKSDDYFEKEIFSIITTVRYVLLFYVLSIFVLCFIIVIVYSIVYSTKHVNHVTS